MIEIKNIATSGWKNAVEGMRNPWDSWEKSDSDFDNGVIWIGPDDLDLMGRLYRLGTEHRKYARMLHISMNVTAPLYWWKEFDTYKVGTTRDSCSTMHKIQSYKFEFDRFSNDAIEECDSRTKLQYRYYIYEMERVRNLYNETKDSKYKRALFQMLPEGFMMKSTVDFSYETAFAIIRQRKNHPLVEWHEMRDVLLHLPYMEEITGISE